MMGGMADLPDLAQRAAALLSQVADGDWAQARTHFDETLAGALDDDGLATEWERVTVESGRYLSQREPVVTRSGALTNVTVPLEFEDATMYGRVSFDADGKVAGLHFLLSDPDQGPDPALPARLVLRCSDGHLYTVTRDTLLYRSIHFGTTQFRPCPVDHKWRRAKFADLNALTRQELEEAESNAV
jgi:Protein of unknown function (DUF3887)